jgi:hypothetical protein
MAVQAPNAAQEGLVRGADATLRACTAAAALRYPRALRHDRMIAQLAVYDPMHQASQLAVWRPGEAPFTGPAWS